MIPLSRRTRIRLALVFAIGNVALVYLFRVVLGQPASDFDQIVIGAHRALAGLTPYATKPLPGLEWPIYYPMPALLLGIPFTVLPLTLAHAVFCGTSGALFAWALSAEGDAKLFGAATWPYLLSISLGQWGPLLMATSTLPAMAWVAIAKPNIALALAFAYTPRWIRSRALALNAAIVFGLIAGSFAIRPTWFAEWRSVIGGPTPHIIVPATVLGGPLLLLALLRWRRPEARLLVGLACVPQTFSSYDSLLVFLVARTRKEALILVAGALATTVVVGVSGTAPTYGETVHKFAPFRIALMYLPATAMVLLRPNASASAAVPDATAATVEPQSTPS